MKRCWGSVEEKLKNWGIAKFENFLIFHRNVKMWKKPPQSVDYTKSNITRRKIGASALQNLLFASFS